MKKIAVFDFDNTLTTQDCLMPFLRFCVGKWRYLWGLIWCSPVLIAYFLKLIPNWKAKQFVLKHFLAGFSSEELNQFGIEYAEQFIPNVLRPEAIARLNWHRQQQHKLIIVSASLENYLIPWGKKNGFVEIIGTKLSTKQDKITGFIEGKNCYGEEKVNRLKEILGDLSEYSIYAYGDSEGDRQLLEIADYPYYRTFSDDNNNRIFAEFREKGKGKREK